MSQERGTWPDAPMLKLDTVDSTNNYAMQLIDADKAEHGLTILAGEQTAGKGQRGKSWIGAPGESLMMSIILKPDYELHEQTLFLAAVAVAVAEQIQIFMPGVPVRIKWPNDILFGDKKAGGILIENIVRGQTWQWAIAGIGLNIGQVQFPDKLPYATSMHMSGGRTVSIEALAGFLRDGMLNQFNCKADGNGVLTAYNRLLYQQYKDQRFRQNDKSWIATITGMNAQGQLMVSLPDGSMQQYTYGTVEWVWG